MTYIIFRAFPAVYFLNHDKNLREVDLLSSQPETKEGQIVRLSHSQKKFAYSEQKIEVSKVYIINLEAFVIPLSVKYNQKPKTSFQTTLSPGGLQ